MAQRADVTQSLAVGCQHVNTCLVTFAGSQPSMPAAMLILFNNSYKHH